ncbi:DUF502 domain-containing protein [Eudoraea sp.]|uniref:DUF502 domain-containing protein n=1 Tax=Eudoraea sp. TaxID=1979955 RepID=UPI003C782C11
MKNKSSFIKTTLIGGFFFVIPMGLLILLLLKVIDLMRTIVAPLASRISIKIVDSITLERIVSVLILVFLCFIAGLLAKTAKAKQLQKWIEDNILSIIPGYFFFKGMGEEAIGIETTNLRKVVLVDIEEVWQIGFLMDEIDSELFAVFVPGAPNPSSGDVLFVKKERLKIINITELTAMKIYKKMGVDAHKLLDKKVNHNTF